MSLGKQVVRFALRVRLLGASVGQTALRGEAGVHVEWKRGKHHGQTSVAVVNDKTHSAAWESGRDDVTIACTMYVRKGVYEDKALSLSLVAGRHSLGRITVQLDELAAQMVEHEDEHTWQQKGNLADASQLTFAVTLKRLRSGQPTTTVSNTVTTPVTSSSASISTSRRRPESPPSTLSESPLQPLESAPPPVFSPPLASPSPIPRLSHIRAKATSSTPNLPAMSGEKNRSVSAEKSAVGTPTPIPNNVVAHQKYPHDELDLARNSPLLRSSEADVTPVSNSAREKKRNFMHGHRRGKSHAVTPDELRGLHSENNRVSSASMSTTQIPSLPRKSQQGSKLPFGKLKHQRGTSGGSGLAGNLSPRTASHSSSSLRESQTRDIEIPSAQSLGAEAFLIDESSSELSDADETAMAVALHTQSRSPHHASGLGRRGSKNDSEVESLKKQLAEESRKRDESFVLTQYVTYCVPVVSHGIPLSSWVLLRCLQEWNGFSSEGRLFRERLLESVERMTGAVQLDESRLLYWSAALVALLALLDSNLSLLPRSEVARRNARTVFAERLRGLAGRLMARTASAAVAELKPLVVPALLHHGALDGSGKKNKKEESVEGLIRQLEEFRTRAEAAGLGKSGQGELLRLVGRGMTVEALNSLLSAPSLCTFSTGLQSKQPLAQLSGWIARLGPISSVFLSSPFSPLEEAVNVLCMDKSALVDPVTRAEVCPHLSSSQLAQLLLIYTPDDFDSEPIHPRVLAQLCGDEAPRAHDYRLETEVRNHVLALDLSDVSFDLSLIELPQSLLDEPSLSFLNPSSHTQAGSGAERKDDAW